jgi:hypothetical protein
MKNRTGLCCDSPASIAFMQKFSPAGLSIVLTSAPVYIKRTKQVIPYPEDIQC